MHRQQLLPVLLLLVVFGACRESGGWSPEVGRLVDGLIEERATAGKSDPKPLVVFDFDNTMIDGDVSHALLTFQADHLRYGFDQTDPDSRVFPKDMAALFTAVSQVHDPDSPDLLRRQIRYRVLQRYYRLWKEGGKEAGLTFLVQVLKGLMPREVHELTRETLALALGTPRCLRTHEPAGLDGGPVEIQEGIRYRRPIEWMVRKLTEAGFDVWVVSASPGRVVEEAVRHYGISSQKVIGNKTVERAGRLTGDLLTPITYRKGKVEAIQKYIGRRPVLVFGDAWTDWEMLNWARNGVLVDRGKSDLNEAARREGILIQPRFPDEPPWEPCQAVDSH